MQIIDVITANISINFRKFTENFRKYYISGKFTTLVVRMKYRHKITTVQGVTDNQRRCLGGFWGLNPRFS